MKKFIPLFLLLTVAVTYGALRYSVQTDFGNPEGASALPQGMLYVDNSEGKLYVKTTHESFNTGWEQLLLADASDTFIGGTITNTLLRGVTITNSTFTGTGTIAGTITSTATISGGTYSSSVLQNPGISGASSTLAGTLASTGTIDGGTITNALVRGSTITNSTINGATTLEGTVTSTGTLDGGTITNVSLAIGSTLIKEVSALQTLAAGDTIAITSAVAEVVGDGGAVTLSSTPHITAGVNGQMLILFGTDDAAALTVSDSGTVPNSDMQLGAATRALGAGDVLMLMFSDLTDEWYEMSFTNN